MSQQTFILVRFSGSDVMKSFFKQECTPVGCVQTATVVISGQGHPLWANTHLLGRHPWQTPPGRSPQIDTPLWADTHSLGRHFPRADSPSIPHTPLGRHHMGRHPLWADTPWVDTPCEYICYTTPPLYHTSPMDRITNRCKNIMPRPICTVDFV